MSIFETNSGAAPHSQADTLLDALAAKQIGRREFLHSITCLGVTAMSARAALALVGGAGAALLPGSEAEAAEPVAGGTMRMVCAVQEMTDPSTTQWFEAANIFRNSLEYLTRVDEENIVHPYLAESFTPSEDLKTWTFKLRPGVKWSNGDDFTADDVAFTIDHWTNDKSTSANKTSFAGMSFEKVGPLEFKLVLDRGLLSLPEMLYAPACPILHKDFLTAGGDWPKNPLGTGPYELAEFAVSQKAVLRKRADYWDTAPLLDELQFLDLGTDISTHLAALSAGQIDILYRLGASEMELAKALPDVVILEAPAAQTVVMRMQMDQAPFDDIRVRQAIQMAADPAQMLEVALRGAGQIAENHHVAPFQPEYFKLPPKARDVEGAKALLKEAGKEGLEVSITVGNTQGTFEQDTCLILQQNLAEAGIVLKVDVLPTAEYWNVWDKVPFGLTYWAHRPLAVMTLDLAYRGGAAWNESHYSDPAFDAALTKAMGIVDPAERSQVMETVEAALRDSAVMVQPYWIGKYTAVSSRVNGYKLHPSDAFDLFGTWIAPAA